MVNATELVLRSKFEYISFDGVVHYREARRNKPERNIVSHVILI